MDLQSSLRESPRTLYVAFYYQGVGVGIADEVEILLQEGYWHMRPLCFEYRNVHQDIVNFSEVVAVLPLVLEL